MMFRFQSRGVGARLAFRAGARAYDALTDQGFWREQIRQLLDHVPPPTRPVRVLDLGTGPGASAFVLAEALPSGSEVVGVDISPEMIARARRHHGRRYSHLPLISFLESDACDLPFPARRFDLVTGHSFLYLVPDPEGVLREARRVLRPGGFAIFLEPAEGVSLFGAAAEGFKKRELALSRPGEGGRFALSMLLWRLMSRAHGRMSETRLSGLFAAAGLELVHCRPTLAGLGLHGVARA